MKILCRIFGHKWKLSDIQNLSDNYDCDKIYNYKCSRCKDTYYRNSYSVKTCIKMLTDDLCKDSFFKEMFNK